MDIIIEGKPYHVHGFVGTNRVGYVFLSEDGEMFLELRHHQGKCRLHSEEGTREIIWPPDLWKRIWDEPGCATCKHRVQDEYGMPYCRAQPPAFFLLVWIDSASPSTAYRILSTFKDHPLIWPASENLCPSYAPKPEDED